MRAAAGWRRRRRRGARRRIIAHAIIRIRQSTFVCVCVCVCVCRRLLKIERERDGTKRKARLLLFLVSFGCRSRFGAVVSVVGGSFSLLSAAIITGDGGWAQRRAVRAAAAGCPPSSTGCSGFFRPTQQAGRPIKASLANTRRRGTNPSNDSKRTNSRAIKKKPPRVRKRGAKKNSIFILK